MLLSPIFFLDLVRAVRTRRFFANRTIYGAILLAILLANYSTLAAVASAPYGGFGYGLPWFGRIIFLALAMVQYLGIILITPSQVAPAIAEERQRKRLHDLLLTPLSSTEIVLGKLGVKLLTLMTYVAISLPVASLLTLVGGVDPLLVAVVYLGTFSTAFFVGSVAIMCSVFAPKVRTAVSWSYAILAIWMIVLPQLDDILTLTAPAAVSWVQPVTEWIDAANPIGLVSVSTAMAGRLTAAPLFWMIGLQIAYGAVFLFIATARLRPSFRSQEGRPVGVGWKSRIRRWRIFPLPPCGDDPILWKEKYTARGGGLTRILTFLISFGLFIGVSIATYVFASAAFRHESPTAVQEFNWFLCGVGVGGCILMALGAASITAASVTAERESTTWLSLMASPLTGAQIVRGKLLGALWRLRFVPALVLVVWAVGVVARSLHPLALVFGAVEFVAFVVFAAALGLYLSAKSPSTAQAQNGTTGLLLALNAGPFCCLGVWPIRWMTCAPWILMLSLFAYEDQWRIQLLDIVPESWWEPWLSISSAVVGVLLYAAGAVYFTYAAIGAVETAANRPRRSQYASMRIFTRESLRKNQEIAARSVGP